MKKFCTQLMAKNLYIYTCTFKNMNIDFMTICEMCTYYCNTVH